MSEKKDKIVFIDAMRFFCKTTIESMELNLQSKDWLDGQEIETIVELHKIKGALEIVLAYIETGRKSIS